MQINKTIILLVFLIITIFVPSAYAAENLELFRIRILNSDGGPIEVSSDKGSSYLRVGSVTHAATTSKEGFLASIYANPGTVAVTAVHGIRIKVAGNKSLSRAENRVISIIPKEFDTTPKGFGGHIAGSSGICTDIPAGTGIFRNLAPFAGNPVYLDTHGSLIPLPDGYNPKQGDVIVIIVNIPSPYPKEIIFENRKGGSVEVIYADKREKIAIVEQPVKGTGRFDATGYTGIGRINTNHTGVVTVSTASLNGGEIGSTKETRGGFQIVPSNHARSLDISPQIMIVAPVSPSTHLEGTEPIFSKYIGLIYDPSDEKRNFNVKIKTVSSDWIPIPEIIGKRDNSLVSLPGSGESVTFIKLIFPEITTDWVVGQIQRSYQEHINLSKQQAAKNGTLITDESITLSMSKSGMKNISYVNLYIDGSFRGVSNNPPYVFTINATALSPGEHHAELRAVDNGGNLLDKITKNFFIFNP
ncbi:MAG: Ig-like domain-containing protein [Armatimonadota bacterium]